MSVKIFVLGRPGSGKSHVAQFIRDRAISMGWTVEYIYDYKWLQALFLEEIRLNIPEESRAFRAKGPEGRSGFDVVDFSVLNLVLQQIANEIRRQEREAPLPKKLFVIEFARKSYLRALQFFGQDLLQDAHLLYLQADFETCKARIHQRIGGGSELDHYVSDNIMESYYKTDDWGDELLREYLSRLQKAGIRVQTKETDNSGSNLEINKEIGATTEQALSQETEPISVVVQKAPQPKLENS
ncbi:MAG TPA: hypothetical protein VFA41_12715 [Ktedonobacteraceae bacterium]|jgi:dephospho-CoA kinase|nr:hypothetical protein [Ktedonobacteraceae bacterium]